MLPQKLTDLTDEVVISRGYEAIVLRWFLSFSTSLQRTERNPIADFLLVSIQFSDGRIQCLGVRRIIHLLSHSFIKVRFVDTLVLKPRIWKIG